MILLLTTSPLLEDDNGGVDDEDDVLFEPDIKPLFRDEARNRLKMHFIILDRPSPIIER
jgi:hypothetical protein